MFGYVIADKTRLTKDEIARYRSFYCGVCVSIGKRYSQLPRLTLSYDMPFLAMLLTSLYEKKDEGGQMRCVHHLMQKQHFISSDIIDYCADMNLLLAYYKCIDDINDDNSLSARFLKSRLEKPVSVIKQKYPKKAEVIHKGLEALSKLERESFCSLDACLKTFGNILGEIFVFSDDNWAKTHYNTGSALGEFIYAMDAYEDHGSDIKKGSFNPLHEIMKEKDGEDQAVRLLNMLMGRCAMEADKLPLEQDISIINNILYHGVWVRFNLIRYKKTKGKERAAV